MPTFIEKRSSILILLILILSATTLISMSFPFWLFKRKDLYTADRIDWSRYNNDLYDLVIIGKGPAGLSSAIYSGRSGLITLCVGIMSQSLLAQTDNIENFPGYLGSGVRLLETMSSQALEAGCQLMEGKVVHIEHNSWPYILTLDNGKKIHTLGILIATGSTPKMLGIKGEWEYWCKGVSCCAVCDSSFFEKNEEIFVVGAGDSACTEALYLLESRGVHVTILARCKEGGMKASDVMQKRVAEAGIPILYETVLKEIIGDGDKVTHIKIKTNDTEKTIQANGVFITIGHTPNTNLFKDLVTFDQSGYIINNQDNFEKFIVAAGDSVDPLYRQAAIAAGNGIEMFYVLHGMFLKKGFSRFHEQHPRAFVKVSSFNESKKINDILEKQHNRKHSAPLATDITIMQEEHENSKREERVNKGSGDIHHIHSLDEINDLIASGKTFLIDFFADWCGPCKELKPLLFRYAEEVGKVPIYMVDVSKVQGITEKFSIRGIPVLVIFKEGKEVGRKVGLVSYDQLLRFIAMKN